MFFFLSKILVPLETPGDLLLLLLGIGLILSWTKRLRRAGAWMLAMDLAALLLIAILPISTWVSLPLENRFPRPRNLPAHVDGIVVLGGAIDPILTERHGIPSLNSAAERMTEFVRLAKRYPDAKLAFSGGSGRLSFKSVSFTEADAARLFFEQQGLDASRVAFERRSRNTYENVIFTKSLVKPLPGQIWLLISTARDMPRSVGIFRQAGWPVVPVPVAYKTGLPNEFILSDKLKSLDDATHEWLGLLIYRIAGKTDALFPGPG